MIKIDTSKLGPIADDYFDHLKAELQHRSLWNDIDQWAEAESGGALSSDDIFNAKFDDLLLLASIFQSDKYPDCVLALKDIYKTLTTSGLKIREDTTSYTAYRLVSSIGIQVCPYCNRNYINNVSRSKRRTSQLDHFFDKDCYPFLAVTFYNLIPSCGPCNLMKGNILIDVSPYSSEAMNDYIKFDFYGISDQLDTVKLKMEVNPEIASNHKVFHLEDVYDIHLDYLKEILIKKKTYPPSQIAEHLKNFPNLYNSEEEVRQVLFANYLSEDEFHKRPLSKLTSDIVGLKK